MQETQFQFLGWEDPLEKGPGDLPNPGIKHTSPVSSTLAGDNTHMTSFTLLKYITR